MDFQPYQALWRLAGVDHMHVHGLAGKFAQADDEVVRSAHDCLTPLADPRTSPTCVMPAFSSGQWAGTLPATIAAVPTATCCSCAAAASSRIPAARRPA